MSAPVPPLPPTPAPVTTTQAPDPAPLGTVRIRRAPLRLWQRSTIHRAELIREFSLLSFGEQREHLEPRANPHADVPRRLLDLAADLGARHAGFSEAQEDELELAITAGELTHDFTYEVPTAVAVDARKLEHLLDEADRYCEHGDLMTLVTPSDQRAFRHWYIKEFVRQLAGAPPSPWDGPLT